ncbi:MAG: hypothetical protein AAB914_00195 [Patescibacteria group bacterium]
MELKDSPTRCILYEIDINQSVAGNLALASAQSQAIAQQLPFAVIYFHPSKTLNTGNKEVLQLLQKIEKDLSEYNINLMVFIGDRKDRLEGINMYLKPVNIYDQNIELLTDQKLQIHPIKWHGVVFSTQILEARILAGL